MVGPDSISSLSPWVASAIPPQPSSPRIRPAWWLAPVSRLFLGLLPLVSVPVLAAALIHSHELAFDFHGWYWPAGHRVLDGLSPYALPVGSAYKYPAVGALLVTPFALLPRMLADWVFTALVLAAVPATLRLLDIGDWRIYGAVMLWQPVVYGWETANITLLLVLGLAVAWHYRDRAVAAGAVIGLLISVKLFLLPIGLWLLATRRYAALTWAAVITLVLNASAWSVLGFGEASRYVRLLGAFTPGAERRGYSLISLLIHQGATTDIAYAVALAAAAAAAAAGLVAGRRGNDSLALTSCLAASLLASPLVESHYLALLIVPLALTWRRFSVVWLLPLALWPAPVDHAASWQQLLTLCVAGVLVAAAAERARVSARFRPPHFRLGATRGSWRGG